MWSNAVLRLSQNAHHLYIQKCYYIKAANVTRNLVLAYFELKQFSNLKYSPNLIISYLGMFKMNNHK